MMLERFLLALAAVLFAAPCLAASVAERSPFAQGHWWNPARSGNGFDIFNAVGQVAVTWYTFEESGRPTWYTALGAEETLGKQSWPLMRQNWTNGRMGTATQVGTVKLSVNHAESMDLDWDIGGKQGTWAIQPLIVSGAVAEVDHGGSWFDPAQSGWGFGLTEQGNAFGGVLFTYDATGAPTWANGFEVIGVPVVEYFTARGSCPWCTYQPTVATSVGNLAFDFASEIRGSLRGSLRMAMAPGVQVDGASITMFSRPASTRPADRQLASFDDDAPLKTYLGAGLLNTGGPQGAVVLPSPAPVSAAPAFSTTNLQESGVDEADFVKSDGRNVYAFAYDGYGRIQPAIRIVQVGNEGASLDVRGSVALSSGASTALNIAGLYLQGDRLAAVTGSQPYIYYGLMSPILPPGGVYIGGQTRIEIFDAANPTAPATMWSAQFDGYLVTSRRIGDRLYVVTRFVPALEGFYYYGGRDAQNQQLLASTAVDKLLPTVRINGGSAERFIAASSTFAPPQGSRKPLANLIVVTAIDLREPKIAQSLAIAGTVETVYVSSDHLFLATSRADLRDPTGRLLPYEPPNYITDIHQVRLGTGSMSVVGSGSIEGYLSTDPDQGPFRMSEYQGTLRAVTSSSVMWGSTKNHLSILRPSTITPGLLKTVSVLPNAKRPESLGKPNEFLHSTRFAGDRLFAVTFKKIDPLYVVDLSDSADPKIAGALELPGFSDYLHPLPNGLMLGFGKEARTATESADGQFAWYQGLQLSLYDVGDAAHPRELQRVLMGKRGSDSTLLRDHHAFSTLGNGDGSSLIAFPASLHDGMPSYGSGDSTYYNFSESGLMRFELRGSKATDAALVQLPSLITNTASNSSPGSIDPATFTGRSILFPNGTIYYGYGKFWQQSMAGSTSGPF